MWLVFLAQSSGGRACFTSDRWSTGRKPMWAKAPHAVLSALTTQSHCPKLNASHFLSKAPHYILPHLPSPNIFQCPGETSLLSDEQIYLFSLKLHHFMHKFSISCLSIREVQIPHCLSFAQHPKHYLLLFHFLFFWW